jgi:hypothetical protein
MPELARRASQGMSRDDFAQWVAQKHLAIDPEIREIHYLPTNAASREVRLLEVNTRLAMPHALGPVEPVDFMPDIDGLDFILLVADVSPEEWEAIRRQELGLPDGWVLDEHSRSFGRQRP